MTARLLLAPLSAAVAALVAVALHQPAAPPPGPPPPDEPPPVAALFFGDSYFNGTEHATKLQSVGYLAADRLGYWPMVGGAGGTGFTRARAAVPGGPPGRSDYLGQFRAGALDTVYRPSLVVLQGGLNDRGSHRVEDAAEGAVQALRQRWPGVTVVLVGPVDLPGADPVAEALSRAARDTGAGFVDARRWDLTGTLAPDGVHPTREGSAVMARSLVADLRRAGVDPAPAGRGAR